MEESRLYKPVADFIRDEFDCFAVETTKGMQYGMIDVVGLRYSMNRRGGSSEVIAVEVKTGISGLLKSLGQALGYSVMADRCYLAVYNSSGENIGQTEREFAAQLNVGLISITQNNKFEFEVLLSSPRHIPIRSHRITLVRSIGFQECVLCGAFWPTGNAIHQTQETDIHKVTPGKGFRYSLPALAKQRKVGSADWRYFCGDCVAAFSGGAPQATGTTAAT